MRIGIIYQYNDIKLNRNPYNVEELNMHQTPQTPSSYSNNKLSVQNIEEIVPSGADTALQNQVRGGSRMNHSSSGPICRYINSINGEHHYKISDGLQCQSFIIPMNYSSSNINHSPSIVKDGKITLCIHEYVIFAQAVAQCYGSSWSYYFPKFVNSIKSIWKGEFSIKQLAVIVKFLNSRGLGLPRYSSKFRKRICLLNVSNFFLLRGFIGSYFFCFSFSYN